MRIHWLTASPFVYFSLALCFTTASIIGLTRRRRWGRTFGLISSAMATLSCGIQGILGLLILISLWKDKSAGWFVAER